MTINCYGVDCTGWTMIHPKATADMLGYVPRFLREDDPGPARQQFQERYEFGGWKPNVRFKMLESGAIEYPGDPVLPPVCERRLRDERIVIYTGALFAIIQSDGSFQVARLD